MTDTPLIEIRDLRVTFHGDDGRTTHAVDTVDLTVGRGATLGLVGESGCGKSVTSLAVMGLLPKQSAEVTGSISFDGFDLLNISDQVRRDLRGNRLAMIFQEPMTSLNPSFTIGDQIIETILRHRGGSRSAGGGGHSGAAQLRQHVSNESLRRDASARDDRDGAGVRAAPADRR
jgi:peptide/nickel transport system ATP-binding protein